MSYYIPVTEKPETKQQGLINFVQMAINDLETYRNREALLKLVDLRDDLSCGVYKVQEFSDWDIDLIDLQESL